MCIRDSQVVPLGQVAVEDLSGQATADTVGLDQDECAFGHAGNLSGDSTAAPEGADRTRETSGYGLGGQPLAEDERRDPQQREDAAGDELERCEKALSLIHI